MTTCYNPSKKFAFIHVHKCAGTAITKAFMKSEKQDNPDWEIPRDSDAKSKSIMDKNNERIDSQFSAPEHFRAMDMQDFLGPDVYASYFKFAVSRNPWDRLASWYFFLRHNQNKGQSKIARQLTMEDFIKYSVDHFYLPQYQWVTDHEGEIIVDEIIKLDDLSERWPSIVSRISDEPLLLRTVNSSPNTTEPRPNPFAHVRTETLEMFRDAYAKDFDLLGYDKTLPDHRDQNETYKKCEVIWQAEVAGARDGAALCKKQCVSEELYNLYREANSANNYGLYLSNQLANKKDVYKNNLELRRKFKDDFSRLQAKIKNLSEKNTAISQSYKELLESQAKPKKRLLRPNKNK